MFQHIRPLQRNSLTSHIFLPQRWIRKKKRKKIKRTKSCWPSCLLAVNLSHFAGASLQSWLSAKHCTDFALAYSRNASRHRCKEVCHCLPLSTSPGTLAHRVPKSLDPSLCWRWWDWAGSRRALTPITNIRQKKTARTWKMIPYFQQQRRRVGKILKCVHCAWDIERKAPLKSLHSSNLSVLPRISRQELPPHAPQGRNQLLIKRKKVTEMR